MNRWRAFVRVSRKQVTARVLDPQDDEVLRARLPRYSDHPRALLTWLEGLALWSGAPLFAVVAADNTALECVQDLLGGVRYPADSALVRIEVEVPGRRLRLRPRAKTRTPGAAPASDR